MPELIEEFGQHRLDSLSLNLADSTFLSEWQAFRLRNPSPSPMHDPDWLRGFFEEQIGEISVYSLYQSDSLCGVAPMLLSKWPLKCHLGELAVASFPLTRLRLLGGTPGFPPDDAAYDCLFSELARSTLEFDALYLEEIPIDSFLWKYVHRSDLIRQRFLVYEPEPPSPRPILRLGASFEHYLEKFSSKHRSTLLRKVKKLRSGVLGELRLARYEHPEEVSAFLEQAVEISKRTYQWTMHRKGLSGGDVLRKRLIYAAEHGWMRSYLLFCGERPSAFLVGFQYGGRYLLHDLGFDPDLAKYSVGTVLQLLTVEDLFSYNRPEIFDLQEYGRYKEELSTESHIQGKIFLFRRGLYPRVLRAGHRCCRLSTQLVSTALDRLNLKSKVKKAIRRSKGAS